MKAYSIPSPRALRCAAEGIKWDKDYRKAMELADTWERESWDDQQEMVTLEVGKNAHLFHTVNGKKTLLAAMYTAAAKDFVKGLDEI